MKIFAVGNSGPTWISHQGVRDILRANGMPQHVSQGYVYVAGQTKADALAKLAKVGWEQKPRDLRVSQSNDARLLDEVGAFKGQAVVFMWDSVQGHPIAVLRPEDGATLFGFWRFNNKTFDEDTGRGYGSYVERVSARLIRRDEMVVVLDRDCPQCGFPELTAAIEPPWPTSGCKRCGYGYEPKDVAS